LHFAFGVKEFVNPKTTSFFLKVLRVLRAHKPLIQKAFSDER